MTEPIHIQTRVAHDGVLTVRVPLGASAADTDVRVTIEPVPDERPYTPGSADWHAFVTQTYGSCNGLDLRSHDQGAIEKHDPIE